MSFNRVATVSALTAVAAIALSGCTSAQKALGMSKVVPDEFRVVSKAPLAVPPDYALRPPAPGEPRPQELQPESAARAALIGQSNAANRSEGEKLLVARAGSEKADPLIRFVVDDENGDLAHKDETFTVPRESLQPAPDVGVEELRYIQAIISMENRLITYLRMDDVFPAHIREAA